VGKSINNSPFFFMPHWFVLLLLASISAAAWLPWRFSLSTLLIAMTLLAVGLGWLVYAIRS
jgi:hypothetical protein